MFTDKEKLTGTSRGFKKKKYHSWLYTKKVFHVDEAKCTAAMLEALIRPFVAFSCGFRA